MINRPGDAIHNANNPGLRAFAAHGQADPLPGWADQTSVNLADFLSALTAWVQRGVASGTIPAPFVSTAIGSYEANPQP